jgi:hypothetical protein
MWLLRGLKFTALGLRSNLDNPNEELSASFTKGYENSLKKYHGMMVRPIFYVSLDAPLSTVLTSRSLTARDESLSVPGDILSQTRPT